MRVVVRLMKFARAPMTAILFARAVPPHVHYTTEVVGFFNGAAQSRRLRIGAVRSVVVGSRHCWDCVISRPDLCLQF